MDKDTIRFEDFELDRGAFELRHKGEVVRLERLPLELLFLLAERRGLLVTRDEILDNVTFYWLTNTGISSARLYWENTFDFFGVKNVAIPAAVTVFPKEIYQAPRSWAERAYPKLIYFNEVDRGCHFAAWQEPALFATEVRAAFRTLR